MSEIAQWIGAIGTVLAVVTALFIQVALVWIRRPRLRLLAFDPATEDAAPFYRELSRIGPSDDSLWLRVRVINAGIHTAREVEVVLTYVAHLGAEGDEHRAGVFPSRSLQWSDVPDGRLDLPAGVPRLVDVAQVMRAPRPPRPDDTELEGTPTDGDQASAVRLILWPDSPGPAGISLSELDWRHWLRKDGLYTLEFVVTATNAKARWYHASLEFSSCWEDDPRDLLRHAMILGPSEGRVDRAKDVALPDRIACLRARLAAFPHGEQPSWALGSAYNVLLSLARSQTRESLAPDATHEVNGQTREDMRTLMQGLDRAGLAVRQLNRGMFGSVDSERPRWRPDQAYLPALWRWWHTGQDHPSRPS